MSEDKHLEIASAAEPARKTRDLQVAAERLAPPQYRAMVGRQGDRDEEGFVSSRVLLQAFLQCWKPALLVALVLSALSTVAILRSFVPSYRASAWVQINDHMPYLAYETAESELQTERYVKTQIELIRGPLVLSSVVSMPGVARLVEFAEMDNPIEWLSRQISVSSIGESQLYQVTYSSPTPDGAAVVVNAVVDQYFELTDQNESARTHRIVDLLELEKTRRKTDVEQLSEKMRDLRHEVVGTDLYAGLPTGDAAIVTRPIDMLQTRLTEAEVDAKVGEAELQALEEDEKRKGQLIPDAVVELETLESPELQAFYRELADRRELLRQTEQASVHGKNDPNYVRLQEEVQRTEEEITRSVKAKRELVREKLTAVAAMEREDELARVRARVQSAEAVFQMLRERYDERLAALKESGDKSLELELTRSELAREEKVFEMIAERVTSLRTEMRAPGRVSLWKRATPPLSPVERFPINHIAVAWMGCFSLPFGVGVLREVLLRRIRSADQIENHMPSSFVTEVAKLPYRAKLGKRGAGLPRSKKASLFEESVDALRTSLMLNTNSHEAKILAVVSAAHREGKTSVSTQLALSIARATCRPTLLIDGDMRAPSLHRIFKVSLSKGLADLLDGNGQPGDAIICDAAEHLDLIPAGRIQKSPHVLTGNDNIYELMDTLRGMYDFIVIDTPPILSASEGLVLAKAADETILCTMQGRSREAQMRLAYQRLTMAGVQVVGAVLSGVPTHRYAYSYGTYY